MAKSKKSKSSKPSVKVRDLKAKKNPKGGALNAYLKTTALKTVKIESPATIKLNTDVSSLNFKK